jgi:hypothetical protein
MENEYMCRRCKGRGTISTKSKDNRGLRACPVCEGKRTVNWLENIFGKEEKPYVPKKEKIVFYSPRPGYWNNLPLATGDVLDRIAKIMGIPSRYLIGKTEQNKKDIIMKGIKNG